MRVDEVVEKVDGKVDCKNLCMILIDCLLTSLLGEGSRWRTGGGVNSPF